MNPVDGHLDVIVLWVQLVGTGHACGAYIHAYIPRCILEDIPRLIIQCNCNYIMIFNRHCENLKHCGKNKWPARPR
jgi:phage FluMu gp28-like protein